MTPESSDPTFASARLRERGRRYDDFEVGHAYRHHWGRTVTEADTLLFATATLAYNPLYLNVELAKEEGHPALVVDPYLVLAIVVGLSVEDLSERSEALLGLEEVEFLEPVYPGDTVTAESVVAGKRPSRSRPATGVVTWSTEGRNQRGRPVVRLTRSNLFSVVSCDAAE
ncbi:MAG TPA: MaoC family dehydratase [Gaiellaceae bacterium]|nr:MaoC family dehydratase [Gaiellaceae bacterium]